MNDFRGEIAAASAAGFAERCYAAVGFAAFFISPTVTRSLNGERISSSNRARLLVGLKLMSNALVSDVVLILSSVAESDIDGSVLVVLNQADDPCCCLLNSVQ